MARALLAICLLGPLLAVPGLSHAVDPPDQVMHDERWLTITNVTTDLDLGLLFIEGRNFKPHQVFGHNPTVRLRRENGDVEKLRVVGSDDTSITARLTSTDPGGRLLIVVAGFGRTRADSTEVATTRPRGGPPPAAEAVTEQEGRRAACSAGHTQRDVHGFE